MGVRDVIAKNSAPPPVHLRDFAYYLLVDICYWRVLRKLIFVIWVVDLFFVHLLPLLLKLISIGDTVVLKSNIMLGKVSRKKFALLLDFVQMRVRGVPCPFFWSIKGVYFLQNVNKLNFKLFFRLYTWPTKQVFCLNLRRILYNESFWMWPKSTFLAFKKIVQVVQIGGSGG